MSFEPFYSCVVYLSGGSVLKERRSFFSLLNLIVFYVSALAMR